MLEILENKKEELQKKYNEAVTELQKYNTLVVQLEGAILSCDEMIKELKDKETK